MQLTPDEKEKVKQLGEDIKNLSDSHQNYTEIILEMLTFYEHIVSELKYSNPDLALRIMNKVTDIMKRGQLA